MNKFKLPTGYLFTDTYSKGELETLSIGDYGKAKNIKADFLGYTKEINDEEIDMDMVVRYVVGYGYLPIVIVDGKEIYRGEFKTTAEEAFNKCCDFCAKYKQLQKCKQENK